MQYSIIIKDDSSFTFDLYRDQDNKWLLSFWTRSDQKFYGKKAYVKSSKEIILLWLRNIK